MWTPTNTTWQSVSETVTHERSPGREQHSRAALSRNGPAFIAVGDSATWRKAQSRARRLCWLRDVCVAIASDSTLHAVLLSRDCARRLVRAARREHSIAGQGGAARRRAEIAPSAVAAAGVGSGQQEALAQEAGRVKAQVAAAGLLDAVSSSSSSSSSSGRALPTSHSLSRLCWRLLRLLAELNSALPCPALPCPVDAGRGPRVSSKGPTRLQQLAQGAPGKNVGQMGR